VICTCRATSSRATAQPSSEINFHTALYNRRADIGAVVHTHSVYATTLACLHLEIPPVHYLVGFAGSQGPTGTLRNLRHVQNWPGQSAATIGSHNAVLLANHGLVVRRPGYRHGL
jgi:L-fuculose-phosphate aldolase